MFVFCVSMWFAPLVVCSVSGTWGCLYISGFALWLLLMRGLFYCVCGFVVRFDVVCRFCSFVLVCYTFDLC